MRYEFSLPGSIVCLFLVRWALWFGPTGISFVLTYHFIYNTFSNSFVAMWRWFINLLIGRLKSFVYWAKDDQNIWRAKSLRTSHVRVNVIQFTNDEWIFFFSPLSLNLDNVSLYHALFLFYEIGCYIYEFTVNDSVNHLADDFELCPYVIISTIDYIWFVWSLSLLHRSEMLFEPNNNKIWRLLVLAPPV